MKVIIVGAGIAGLSLAISLSRSGHHVRVLDSAAQLAELGAGVQMTPQAIKYLFQWGLKEDLQAESIAPSNLYIRDRKDGRVLVATRLGDMGAQYGAPYIVVHRAVLHAILHRHAVRAGAEVLLDSKVVKYDFDNGAVVLRDGQKLDADLVVASDGINSSARSQLLQDLDPGSKPTGWAAFRMMAEVSKIMADPELAGLIDLEGYSSNLWIAPHVSCMTYLVKGATMLNIVLSHRDQIDTTGFAVEDYQTTVKRLFTDFEPRVQRLLHISLPKIVNYPVYAVPPLPHWGHPSGRFTLIGDAAHAMAFYLSMGVSLAVEDAVSLTTALEVACPASAIPIDDKSKTLRTPEAVDYTKFQRALKTFETVRKRRAEAVQQASLRAGDAMLVPEGKQRDVLYELFGNINKGEGLSSQEAKVMKERMQSRLFEGIFNKTTTDWCYGYDAVGDVMTCFQEPYAL